MASEQSKKFPLLSIIIPVYNSEQILENTINDIHGVLAENHYTYEIILVEDGSPDLSWQVAKKLAQDHANVKSIRLTKNYGQHTAIFCGLSFCTGEFIITMDDDGQNPASEVPILVKEIQKGYDVVFAKFETKKHAWYRKIGTKIVRYLNKEVFGLPKGLILSNFRIFTREVKDSMLDYSTNYPYIPGLILLSASTFCNVQTQHKKREIGSSNYSFNKIIKLVSRLLINYSSFPLKVLGYAGIIFTIIPLSIAAYAILNAVLNGSSVKGWTSLMAVLCFLNGMIILMISVLGVYLSRILNQATQPTYLIRERLNIKDAKI